MGWKHWALGMVGAAALGLAAASTGQAAALSGATSFKSPFAATSDVDQVAYRRCWRHNGKRHCRWVEGSARGDGNRDSSYYERDANKLPYATNRWWDQMDREGRGGGRNE